MKIVFWQNIISPHQSFFIRELAEKHEVILVAEKEISAERLQQGWTKPNIGKAVVIIANDKEQVDAIIKQTAKAFHIFSGFFGYPLVSYAFKEVIQFQNVGIIAESAIQMGWKKWGRYVLYRYYAYRYHKKIDFIFAMGTLGVNWYQSVGFDKNKIHEFQYFTEISEKPLCVRQETEITHFVFVGQLIVRKGVDKLLVALKELKNLNWQLTIIGDGILKTKLTQYVGANGLEDKVTFNGNLDNLAVMALLEERADCLILPSRFDGWGAVVNEALSRGIRVIVSDKCGAASLVKNEDFGYIYNEKSKKDLIAKLKCIIETKNNDKAKLRNSFKNKFTSNKVQEFIDILIGNRHD